MIELGDAVAWRGHHLLVVGFSPRGEALLKIGPRLTLPADPSELDVVERASDREALEATTEWRLA